MNNKRRLKGPSSIADGFVAIAIVFGPILIVPIFSPDYWGPMIGVYYQIPLTALALFGPVALVFFIFASIYHWVMIFYYANAHLIKPNLDFQSQIEYQKDNAIQNERNLGRTVIVFIAAYFYHVMIAWYCGLDIYSPKEAMDFVIEMIAAGGSDYD